MSEKVYIEDRATDDRPTFSFGQYWGNFKWPYLREGPSDPLHVWFYGGICGVGGSNGANTGKPRDAASVTRSKFKVYHMVTSGSLQSGMYCLAVMAMG